MELIGSRTVPGPVEHVWKALNDPATLKAAIPGCELFEPEGNDVFRMTIAARVGPVSARFSGKARLSDIQAPRSYSIHFEGNGGAAGFVKGEAQVKLALDALAAHSTQLDYRAKAQVGGKIAQIGSRLVDAAANKVVEEFFSRFVELAAPAETREQIASPRPSRLRRWWVAVASWLRSLFN